MPRAAADAAAIEGALGKRYRVRHIRYLLRIRALCLGGRARPVGGARSTIVWLATAAPLWVIVRVCALVPRF